MSQTPYQKHLLIIHNSILKLKGHWKVITANTNKTTETLRELQNI